mgnify:CR=1 FL=1
MSILPVSSKTLIYGSADGGHTVFTSNKKFNKKMKRIGEALNLKPHLVDGHEIYGPGDIEGHLGTVCISLSLALGVSVVDTPLTLGSDRTASSTCLTLPDASHPRLLLRTCALLCLHRQLSNSLIVLHTCPVALGYLVRYSINTYVPSFCASIRGH